ncbi:MAG TPA: type II toxin-antitoxin system prevent-host-death family antitoxin [Candidatus Kapabacteria bacterium]|jgi:prevent-host-death family protein|nr:type II toxin-antitoxin system prevent-host-death family antitoxin [Candidatus Kapabacteria bacterium]
MQTYSVEAAKNDLSMLAHLAAKGQEVLLTENNQPLAKLVPLDEDEAWRRDIRALRGFAKGIPPFEREEDEERG